MEKRQDNKLAAKHYSVCTHKSPKFPQELKIQKCGREAYFTSFIYTCSGPGAGLLIDALVEAASLKDWTSDWDAGVGRLKARTILYRQ